MPLQLVKMGCRLILTKMAKKVRKVVIPAAGFGTRFLPATKAQPKEMLPIVDKPIIQHVVEQAVEAGIDQVIIVTGWHKRAIEDHFDKHFELEARLEADGKTKLLAEIKKISNLAVVSGFLFTPDIFDALERAIPETIDKGRELYYVDGVNIMIGDGKKVHAVEIKNGKY